MTPRIPPSLAWLIDKRARLDAEMRKTRASLSKAQGLIDDLTALEESLAAIDKTMSLHEIKVDIENIKPIRSHYVRIKVPHGELTKSVLLCLRLREGMPVRQSEIVSFVEARFSDLGAAAEKRSVLSRSIHNRLKGLFREGLLVRHHSPKTNEEGLWSISDTFFNDE